MIQEVLGNIFFGILNYVILVIDYFIQLIGAVLNPIFAILSQAFGPAIEKSEVLQKVMQPVFTVYDSIGHFYRKYIRSCRIGAQRYDKQREESYGYIPYDVSGCGVALIKKEEFPDEKEMDDTIATLKIMDGRIRQVCYMADGAVYTGSEITDFDSAMAAAYVYMNENEKEYAAITDAASGQRIECGLDGKNEIWCKAVKENSIELADPAGNTKLIKYTDLTCIVAGSAPPYFPARGVRRLVEANYLSQKNVIVVYTQGSTMMPFLYTPGALKTIKLYASSRAVAAVCAARQSDIHLKQPCGEWLSASYMDGDVIVHARIENQ